MELAFVPVDDGNLHAVYDIFRRVVARGDSYIYTSDTTLDQFRLIWLQAAAALPYAVLNADTGEVVATFVIRENKQGRGSHVANAGFMVHPERRGLGIGTRICEYALAEAKRVGYLSMQFNVVVSTNAPAVNLWQKMGFRIIGAIPRGFSHAEKGLVDIYIMWREL